MLWRSFPLSFFLSSFCLCFRPSCIILFLFLHFPFFLFVHFPSSFSTFPFSFHPFYLPLESPPRRSLPQRGSKVRGDLAARRSKFGDFFLVDKSFVINSGLGQKFCFRFIAFCCIRFFYPFVVYLVAWEWLFLNGNG